MSHPAPPRFSHAGSSSSLRRPSFSLSSAVRFHIDDNMEEVALAVLHPEHDISKGQQMNRKKLEIARHQYHHNQEHDQPLCPLSPPVPFPPSKQADSKNGAETPPIAGDKKLTSYPSSFSGEDPLAKYEDIASIVDVHQGLSQATVDSQRETYGFNETVEKETPLWLIFARKFYGLTPFMITAAMIISFALQEWTNGAVIAILLLVNAIIAFREDLSARKALRKLMTRLQVMARCQRDGEWAEIPARELVPGDIVRLRTGDIGGADVVLLNGQLSVDQSALTGESDLKSLQRGGVVFAGAIVKRGEANGVVVATASRTYFGQTAKLVQNSRPGAHIDRILNRVVSILMSLILILVVVSLIIMGVRGDDLVAAISLLLMVIVTALPVALPVMYTVSMALGSQELSRRSVLVTRLHVLEDAAMMSMLFSDKTGTMTLNHLSIKSLVPIHPKATEDDILFAAALCSRKENSDPIDRAALESYEQHTKEGQHKSSELFTDLSIQSYRPLHFIPFDATNRRTEATVKIEQAGSAPAVFRTSKGAVATLCSLSGLSPNDVEWKRIDEIVEGFASKGFRTLACGYQAGAAPENDSVKDTPFILLGLIALYDPPRPDTESIIKKLDHFGIQTKMLTGDAYGVAVETGRALGMGKSFVNLEHEKHVILEEWKSKEVAIDMPANSPKQTFAEREKEAGELEARVMDYLLDQHNPLEIDGFAQIFPADKHAIVKHTQEKGIVCGMTGDGVNDAPSLKQAEVGCAVSNATDVAKGSGSTILLNDGLSGIVDLVEIGRQVHRRVEVWFMNKVAKSMQHSVFIMIMFLIRGEFPISAFGVILLLLLMDFVLVSLATDNQPISPTPCEWNLAQLTRIGLVVGLPGAGQIMTLIFLTDYYNVFNEDELKTMAWEALYLWGMASVFCVRESSHLWHSRPSTVMLSVIILETIGVWIVCALGVPGLDAIGWGWASIILGLALGCMIINDFIKTMYIKYVEKIPVYEITA